MERIDLSAHGFYKTPDIGFDWGTGKGIPFRYFTYGAAFAEVEIDTLVGDFRTRQADVILDLGLPLNPAIDVGQVFFFASLHHCAKFITTYGISGFSFTIVFYCVYWGHTGAALC